MLKIDKELYKKLEKYMTVAYEQRKLKNDYSHEGKFSFFMAVADQYRKENFHSDLLKVILDPNTPQIGNPRHLQNFLDCIGQSSEAFGDLESIKNNVKVEREEHRVDLLIKYDYKKTKKAIIIENKINNAVDQDNQLAKYYEALSQEGYKVIAIPYITKFGGKIPDYNSWDDEYKPFIKRIFEGNGALFYDLPVDRQDGCNKDLISFLNNCIADYKTKKITGDKELTYLFLEQYKLLLEEVVESTDLTNEEISMMEELFNNSDSKTINDFVESWGRRGDCAFEFINHHLEKEINLKTVHGSNCLVIETNNKIFEGVYLYPAGDSIQIGFYRRENNWNPNIVTNAKNSLKEICGRVLQYKIDLDCVYFLKNWVYVIVGVDQFDTFDDIKNGFKKALIELSKFKP